MCSERAKSSLETHCNPPPKEEALLETSHYMVLLGQDLCCLSEFCNINPCWEELGTLKFPETPHLCWEAPVGGRSRKMRQRGLMELDLGGVWMRKALCLSWRCCSRTMERKCSPLKTQSWPVFLSRSCVLWRSSCALTERRWVAWCHRSYLKITKEVIFTNLCICSWYCRCCLIADGRCSGQYE